MRSEIEVDTARLLAASEALASSLGPARDLAAHRGHLAGRAEGCGSDDLADAFAGFIGAWGRCMERLVGDAESLAKALKAAAGTYARIEASVKAGPS